MIRDVHEGRWGRTKLEDVMKDLVPVNIEELARGPDTDGKFPEKRHGV